MPKSISSVTGFVRKVGDLTNLHGSGRILYRGHSDSAFDFVPSIFRRIGWRYNEDTMIRKLLAKHPGEFQNDLNTFDKLVRAQHYGLPTRLLDVTLNPLAA